MRFDVCVRVSGTVSQCRQKKKKTQKKSGHRNKIGNPERTDATVSKVTLKRRRSYQSSAFFLIFLSDTHGLLEIKTYLHLSLDK